MIVRESKWILEVGGDLILILSHTHSVHTGIDAHEGLAIY